MNYEEIEAYFKGENLATASTESLNGELDKRKKNPNLFPLEVFTENLHPLLDALIDKYDLPRAYVGMAFLSSYSTAIGTAYSISTNGKDQIYLPVWGGLLGLSSSGKSTAINIAYAPLMKKQREFNQYYQENIQPLSDEKKRWSTVKQVIFRDTLVQTLARYTLPDNPKGLCKNVDELIEWINGLNPMAKREGTDEQFWISTWNCFPYSMMRSGKQQYVVERPFVNVIGGIQWDVLPKIFNKDRDTSGFAFRILFACAEHDSIQLRDPFYTIPTELEEVHHKAITRLYEDLEVESFYDEPKKCLLSKEAVTAFYNWRNIKAKKINRLKDLNEKQKHAGIFGKINEYALRFAGILHLMDRAMDEKYDNTWFNGFKKEELIDTTVMERSLKLADYFYTSAIDVYERVQTRVTAPPRVLRFAALFNTGHSYRAIAASEYKDESRAAQKKVEREISKMVVEYPKIFRADNR